MELQLVEKRASVWVAETNGRPREKVDDIPSEVDRGSCHTDRVADTADLMNYLGSHWDAAKTARGENGLPADPDYSRRKMAEGEDDALYLSLIYSEPRALL